MESTTRGFSGGCAAVARGSLFGTLPGEKWAQRVFSRPRGILPVPSDLIALPIGERAPEIVHAVIEIPLGSRNKYEYRPDLGVIMRDRVLSAAVRYPTDYGFIPSTLTDDGDPLDILVAAYDPAFPGCILLVRPLGVLDMTDEKGRDYKIFAVPADDPRFAEVTSLDDLPSHI